MQTRSPRFASRFATLLPVLLLALAMLPGSNATAAAAAAGKPPEKFPVRGLHLGSLPKAELPGLLKFIRETLPRLDVNTLILEINYGFDFQSRKEFSDPGALNAADLKQVVEACRAAKVELIPQVNCLGHQSWAKRTDRLLTKHPEFDESPGKFPDNKDIYCRSYCPLHPGVHAVLFDLMDELARACEAKSFHVGMDEVFILADPDCPRCKGKDKAELFAGEVTRLRDHLRTIGCRLWLWGDRFLDGKATKLGEWEASENGTARAVDLVPKDIVICDWHYEAAPDTPRFFAGKGFDVVTCPWRKQDVALAQLAGIRKLRADLPPATGAHVLGVVQTTWCGWPAFQKAWLAQAEGKTSENKGAAEAAACFARLYDAMRGDGAK